MSKPSAPKSPYDNMSKKVKGIIGDTVDAQKKTAKSLSKQADQMVGKKAPQNYRQGLKDIKRVTGVTPKDYMARINSEFAPYFNQEFDQARRQVQNFQPGLLGSSSNQMLMDQLAGIAGTFEGGVQRMGEAGSQRFQALPPAAEEIADNAFNRASTNLMLDPRAVRMAAAPQTTSYDVNNDRLSGIMTYNI